MHEIVALVIVCACFFVGYYAVSHAINYYRKLGSQANTLTKTDDKVIDVKQWDGLDSYYRNILGLDDNFTKEELNNRYTYLMDKYNSIDISDFDSDFIKLAEAKKKDIEDAYRYFSIQYQ